MKPKTLFNKISKVIKTTSNDWAILDINDVYYFEFEFPTPIDNLTKPYTIKFYEDYGDKGSNCYNTLSHDKLDDLLETYVNQCYRHIYNFE